MKQVFFKTHYVEISIDNQNQWVVAVWKGSQTEESVKAGANKMLEALVSSQYSKVLNDNTKVIGLWALSSNWGGMVWIPQMMAAGLKHFAWVLSTSALSQFSTIETLRYTERTDPFKLFEDIESAMDWLKSND